VARILGEIEATRALKNAVCPSSARRDVGQPLSRPTQRN
jgi:hypothetical protein